MGYETRLSFVMYRVCVYMSQVCCVLLICARTHMYILMCAIRVYLLCIAYASICHRCIVSLHLCTLTHMCMHMCAVYCVRTPIYSYTYVHTYVCGVLCLYTYVLLLICACICVRHLMICHTSHMRVQVTCVLSLTHACMSNNHK